MRTQRRVAWPPVDERTPPREGFEHGCPCRRTKPRVALAPGCSPGRPAVRREELQPRAHGHKYASKGTAGRCRNGRSTGQKRTHADFKLMCFPPRQGGIRKPMSQCKAHRRRNPGGEAPRMGAGCFWLAASLTAALWISVPAAVAAAPPVGGAAPLTAADDEYGQQPTLTPPTTSPPAANAPLTPPATGAQSPLTPPAIATPTSPNTSSPSTPAPQQVTTAVPAAPSVPHSKPTQKTTVAPAARSVPQSAAPARPAAAPAASSPAPSSTPTLPFTGLSLLWVMITGLGLVILGVLLRRARGHAQRDQTGTA
jgi:hypothetical protein